MICSTSACQGLHREQASPSLLPYSPFPSKSHPVLAAPTWANTTPQTELTDNSCMHPVARESWCSSTTPTGNSKARPHTPCNPTTIFSLSRRFTGAESPIIVKSSHHTRASPVARRLLLLCASSAPDLPHPFRSSAPVRSRKSGSVRRYSRVARAARSKRR